MKTKTMLLGAVGLVAAGWLFFPPFRYWLAVNFLPAGAVKGNTGSTLRVVS